jgi:FAD-dependent urate hydroxylase
MNVIIIGGGIGGPVTALALQRAGIQASMYEAQAGPAESLGLFLGLGINGMRVLRELDLLDAVMGADVIPTPAMEFCSTSGKRLGGVSNGWLDPATPSVTLMRGRLQQVLADAAEKRGIAIHYQKRFTSYTSTGAGIIAHFADGSKAEGDLLIGADGIRSRVRAVMAPGAPAPTYTGLLNLGGVALDTGLPPTPGAMRMVWGKRAFFGYTIRENGEAWWFANLGQKRAPERGELEAIATAEWQRQLCDLFAADPPLINTMIRHTAAIGAFPIYDMPTLPGWHAGRVALLGDAAHAVSPSAGQGASMAMEDALMLAKCLRDIADPEQALARYEALRRPRTDRIVKDGRRRGTYKAPQHRAALFLRDLLMPLAFRVFVTEKALSWIYDYEIAWE